jgi:hypothetical protein
VVFNPLTAVYIFLIVSLINFFEKLIVNEKYGNHTFAGEFFAALNLSCICVRRGIEWSSMFVINHFKPKNKLNSK